MRETRKETIGEYTYETTQLGALTGRKAFARIAKLAAPALAAAGDGDNPIAALAKAFGDEDVDYFCDVFAPTTTVTGGAYGSKQPQLSGVFDLHFAGKYMDLTKWLLFCLEANFGSFFSELGLSPLAAKESPSPSPKDATGQSGV